MGRVEAVITTRELEASHKTRHPRPIDGCMVCDAYFAYTQVLREWDAKQLTPKFAHIAEKAQEQRDWRHPIVGRFGDPDDCVTDFEDYEDSLEGIAGAKPGMRNG